MKNKTKVLLTLFFLFLIISSFGQVNDVIVKIEYKNILDETSDFNFTFADKIDVLNYRLKNIKIVKNRFGFKDVFKFPIIKFSDSVDVNNCTHLFNKNYDSILESKFKTNVIIFNYDDNSQILKLEFKIIKNKTFTCELNKKLWPSSSFVYQKGSYFSNIYETKNISYSQVLFKIKLFCSSLLSKM